MKLVTHNEDFHTDDVFATALLLELFPRAEVIRSRDESIIATGDIVYDIGKVFDPGKQRFDHHQLGADKRANGIQYSAFGLLWREYGIQFCHGDSQLAEAIDKRLVTPIDAIDNGQPLYDASVFDSISPFTIDDIVGMYNPPLGGSIQDYDKQFIQAVELARNLLVQLRDSLASQLAGQRELLAQYRAAGDKQVIVTKQLIPVTDIIDQLPELVYLISPRPTQTWGILAVSIASGSFIPRQPFPEAWRGQSPERLSELTGMDDVTFCHANGFFAVTKSQQSAVKLAQKSLAHKEYS
jgi:uncharacterized UPF0160 family protein